MKVTMKWLRTVSIPFPFFEAIVDGYNSEYMQTTEIMRYLMEQYGPLPPRFLIHFPESKTGNVTVSTEVMRWDFLEEDIPISAIVSADPMEPKDIAMIDGALRGELERLGISREVDDFQWRAMYSITGN